MSSVKRMAESMGLFGPSQQELDHYWDGDQKVGYRFPGETEKWDPSDIPKPMTGLEMAEMMGLLDDLMLATEQGYNVEDLVEQCDLDAPEDKDAQDWREAPDVGLEKSDTDESSSS